MPEEVGTLHCRKRFVAQCPRWSPTLHCACWRGTMTMAGRLQMLQIRGTAIIRLATHTCGHCAGQ